MFGTLMTLAFPSLKGRYLRRCEAGLGVRLDSCVSQSLCSEDIQLTERWWAIAVLAFNLSSAMKRLVLGGQWVSRGILIL